MATVATLRARTLSCLALTSVLLVALPASAQGRAPARGPAVRAARWVGAQIRQFGAWRQHNRSVDHDERLTAKEFRQLQRSGSAPARVAPKDVLGRKLQRVDDAIVSLRIAANGSRYRLSGGAAMGELFSGTLSKLNHLNAEVYDARAYAQQRGLTESRTRAVAQEALKLTRWHLDAQPASLGIGQLAVVVEGARVSERHLSDIAAAR